MIYWKPDTANTLVSSMLGRFAAPVVVEFSGTYLKTQTSAVKRLQRFLMLSEIEISITYQSCDIVMSRPETWARISSTVCISKLARTGRDNRLAAGRWGWRSLLGPPRPIKIANTVTNTKSKNKNCRSPRLVFSYSRFNRFYLMAILPHCIFGINFIWWIKSGQVKNTHRVENQYRGKLD